MGDCNEVVLVDGPVTIVSTPVDPTTTLVDTDDVTTLVQQTADATLVDAPQIIILQSDGGSGPAGATGATGPPGGFASVVAAENIFAFRVVALDTLGQAYLPDYTTLVDADAVLGIAMFSALTGETLDVITDGLLPTPALWTVGPLYLGLSGILTSVPPTTDAGLQIAYAPTTSSLIVRPQVVFVLS